MVGKSPLIFIDKLYIGSMRSQVANNIFVIVSSPEATAENAIHPRNAMDRVKYMGLMIKSTMSIAQVSVVASLNTFTSHRYQRILRIIQRILRNTKAANR